MPNRSERPNDEPVAGAFAMLDILGFKERLVSMALPELRDKVVGALVTSAAAAHIIVSGDRERAARWGRTELAALDWAYFSDSIVLWLPSGAADARLTMTSMIYACEILVAQAMWLNLPLRGAIAYGECAFSHDPIYYVGKPIIEAYRTEQAQEWAGVAVCESAAAHVHPSEGRVVKWRVPMKASRSRSVGVGPRARMHAAVDCIRDAIAPPPAVIEKEMMVVDWPWACQPTPNWNACFLNSTDASVVRKRTYTATFFEKRRKIGPARGGSVFGPEQDATRWRELYEGSRAARE